VPQPRSWDRHSDPDTLTDTLYATLPTKSVFILHNLHNQYPRHAIYSILCLSAPQVNIPSQHYEREYMHLHEEQCRQAEYLIVTTLCTRTQRQVAAQRTRRLEKEFQSKDQQQCSNTFSLKSSTWLWLMVAHGPRERTLVWFPNATDVQPCFIPVSSNCSPHDQRSHQNVSRGLLYFVYLRFFVHRHDFPFRCLMISSKAFYSVISLVMIIYLCPICWATDPMPEQLCATRNCR
jgi:hypothetical protein